jgi:hypothetical protein
MSIASDIFVAQKQQWPLLRPLGFHGVGDQQPEPPPLSSAELFSLAMVFS